MRNLLILTVVMLAVDLVSVTLSFAVTIQQPQANTVFYPGQKVHVVVNVASDEDVVGMLIETNRGSAVAVEQPPYEADIFIDKAYVGPEEIAVYARLRNGNIIETRTNITVQLPSDVKLEKIIINKRMAIEIASGGKSPGTARLQVTGLFSDGIERDLNILNGVQYTSSDPTLAAVDSKGIVTALKLGWATITIVSGDKNEIVKAHVFIEIELDRELLVKPTETGIQLDWKLSTQDPEWVTGYMVFRTEDPDGIVKKKIADLPNGTSTYIDTTAAQGKTYYYGVQAMSATANERSSMTNMTPGMLP